MKLNLGAYANSLRKDNCYSWSILILRLVVGLAFTLHGFGKIQTPMSWMGPDAPVPGVLQALAAISEFGGGIAWILGLLSPLASFGILCTMIVATLTHAMRGDSFVGMPPVFEPALVYVTIALVMLFNGPGKISLDYLLLKNKN